MESCRRCMSQVRHHAALFGVSMVKNKYMPKMLAMVVT